MKYIIIRHPSTEWLLPIVFDEHLTHSTVWAGDRKNLVSAGFCSKQGEEWLCHGESISLNTAARSEDSQIITMFMVAGLSGLNLANHLMFLRFQAKKEGNQTLWGISP